MNTHLLGTAEVADAVGVTSQAVSNWIKRGQVPEPFARLRMGPVWLLDAEMAAFIESKRRGMGRRPEAE